MTRHKHRVTKQEAARILSKCQSVRGLQGPRTTSNPNRRIIAEARVGQRMFRLHATKGWRVNYEPI